MGEFRTAREIQRRTRLPGLGSRERGSQQESERPKQMVRPVTGAALGQLQPLGARVLAASGNREELVTGGGTAPRAALRGPSR